jgi:hypothetical protein
MVPLVEPPWRRRGTALRPWCSPWRGFQVMFGGFRPAGCISIGSVSPVSLVGQ